MLKIILETILPICLNCGDTLSERYWCRICRKEYFINNLSKWTSGHEFIDDLIKVTQLNAKSEIEYVEWIPYNEFKNINQIGIGGFDTVFSAVWESGPLTMFCGEFTRSGQRNVAIKSLGHSPNITQEFLQELKAHI